MDLPAIYDPSITEEKWYAYWLKHGFFRSVPDDRPKYSMVIPPPNVTGVLHMGHMLNNTIQDVLVRRARMQGKNTCWVPGTDHASIATEAKVVALLKEQGLEKSDMTRETFLKYAWAWKEKHGNIILEQLKKLGASCDWERTSFTMDPDMSRSVIESFVYLYNKGLIYRGIRMVNWDPEGQTAVSDEEVIHREVNEKLYYLKYFFSENGKAGKEYLSIATTRPETIMADVAVCVNPQDERYVGMVGKKVLIPLINKEIPVLADDYVTMDFGTGCLKITPAHDLNDYEIGLRHKLPVIDILNPDGTLNEQAQVLVGEDRFEARRKIRHMLEENGCLEKEEPYITQVGFSERTDAVIEPRLSLQWFVKLEILAKRALAYVEDGNVKLIPNKYRNTYRHWMETARDWCISRQLWWGQQIPAWTLPNGEVVVASTAEEALELARKNDPNLQAEDLVQDPDVVDTWFSSWLWPISVFDPDKPGHPEKESNKELAYYYPTDDLVTAPDILFFWVARMVMAGDLFCNQKPFSNVYLTGMVRDKLGRKMSKSLGNSPDPIELMDQYGADGVRMGLMLCTSAGNDILFDESQVEQGRNFCNKVWNAYRLVRSWKREETMVPSDTLQEAVRWFSQLLAATRYEVDDLLSKYRLSEALMLLYKRFWDDFCSWYLEIIKPFTEEERRLDAQTYDMTLQFFNIQLHLLHPFIPFITEELWQNLSERTSGESIMVSAVPQTGSFDKSALDEFVRLQEMVVHIRGLRQSKQIPRKEELDLLFKGSFPSKWHGIAMRMAGLKTVQQVHEAPSEVNVYTFLIGTTECFVPLGTLLDIEEEKSKLHAELTYYRKFLSSVEKKLANESFLQRAPRKVVDIERKKQSDAKSKIKALEKQLELL
ncbi:MAG: valine--tRNA ligase [Bacteroidales bacterium]|nr:valine--tRNA ligase [Bacteroidales bacterium]